MSWMVMSDKEELTEVLFNQPICIQLDPPVLDLPEVRKQKHLNSSEIRRLVEQYDEWGYGERAIVADATHHTLRQSSPRNWGVVLELNTTMPHTRDYAPIKVQWVLNGRVDDLWPEDLILIHRSISLWEFENLAKYQ